MATTLQGAQATILPLTADLDGNGNVVINGDRSTKVLGKGEPPRRFSFTLTDNTGLNVRFASLDTQDNRSQCPPTVTGTQSGQIVGVQIRNDRTPKEARFTDNNSNPSSQPPVDVCYRWNFTCDDTSQPPISFDPIIRNPGTP
jgi:hypothetical protein